MKQVYFQKGSSFFPADKEAANIQSTLPVGTFTVGVSQAGFHLERVDDFVLPERLYGDVDKRADRILNTFMDRPAGTGVLLSGTKGSGKTMLTKRLAQKAQALGVITILINRPLCGEEFNTFIQSIEQPAIILFDEFEKVYSHDDQAKLLTIMDGTYSSKKMFLLTCNDRFRIDSYMHNRPGRIYYALEFGSLDREFIQDYCADNLKNMSNVGGVVSAAAFFDSFSFDMLKALVEEMNRYNETATEVMQVLNMKPEQDNGGIFDVTAYRDGKRLVGASYHNEIMTGSPLMRKDWFYMIYAKEDDDEVDLTEKEVDLTEKEVTGDVIYVDKTVRLQMNLAKLIHVNPETGTFVFGTDEKNTVLRCVRRKVAVHRFDYDAF